MTEKRGTVAVVTAGGPHVWVLVNALGERFGPIQVILEKGESRAAFLKRRARMEGWASTAGQFATMTLGKLGKRVWAKRIRRMVEVEGLEEELRPEHPITRVSSANGADFLDAVRRIRPDVVLLNGCRILKPATLAAIPCPVLNYHPGITPLYRGMNGGYWALANGDAGNFGATVHLVDKGVDTGAVVAQARGRPGPDDNISTYAHRLAALSRGMVADAVERALSGRLEARPAAGPSRQWFHPPIWLYLWNGVRKGVW